jgi:hypothetical protein
MKMDATFNTTRNKTQYGKGAASVSRALININDIKYDLLKIAEIYDGVLQDGLGHLPADMFSLYLQDLCNDNFIHSYEISEFVLKEHSFTYDVSVRITGDRTPKKLKIHVGLYKSAWPELVQTMKSTLTGYHAK